jgi:UDP-N-acetyl-D-mannosaminouronate:lipid I N-acetyl-D-mannosaminouronosyltransferase
MEYRLVNRVRVFAPSSSSDLVDYAFKNKSLLVAVNAEKILHATDQIRDIINRNVGYPDGVGAVLALKKKGIQNVIKIAGCELWLDLVREHYADKSFYLVGGKSEVIKDTVMQLRSEFSGIQILNYRNGYFKDELEKQILISDIVDKKPDVVFVAMGSPKQELLMEEMSQSHKAVYQGLGGSFDVYTGRVDRAPTWWIDHHLEWLYRLLKEPVRIKRQKYLVVYLWLLFLGKL